MDSNNEIKKAEFKSKGKAWIVSVSMGYGHQRTAYPLRNLAFGGKIINANDYEGISDYDKKTWENKQGGYEFISQFKRIPYIGELAFYIFNEYQKIRGFYPKTDLSKPNFPLKHELDLIRKGFGRNFIATLKGRQGKLPFVTTFFIPAFMAETHKYPGEIFCVICDADISRTWAPLEPKKSRIKYFAPTSWVVERLKLYGVPERNIFFTGYPLPLENIGNQSMDILKEDLRHRMVNLDPEKKFLKPYHALVKDYLGDLPKRADHPLTLMFCVGGAGAQKELGIRLLNSLSKKIRERKIRIIFSAGIKKNVNDYFLKNIEKMDLNKYLGSSLEVIFSENTESYFEKFNQSLRKTDILWTKPSELSFYCALGIPIMVAPTIGYQEEFNKRWLLRIGTGIIQENPDFADEWLFDFLNGGRFAESALEGFINAEKLGTLKIKNIISKI
ncbi:MAG: hypothetical protein Q7T34_00935 [Candidatus Parcubacteria bacterium]|nr:hypothetical protein [Candidatus Parcubacteria bacterium]